MNHWIEVLAFFPEARASEGHMGDLNVWSLQVYLHSNTDLWSADWAQGCERGTRYFSICLFKSATQQFHSQRDKTYLKLNRTSGNNIMWFKGNTNLKTHWPLCLVEEAVRGRQPSIRARLPPAGKRLLLRGPAAKQHRCSWRRRAWKHRWRISSQILSAAPLYPDPFGTF